MKVSYCIVLGTIVLAATIQASAADNTTTYSSPDGVMLVTAPAGWAPCNDIVNNFAVIRLSAPHKHAYAMVISEHKKDLRSGLTLEHYAKLLVGKSSNPNMKLENVHISEPVTFTIDGNPAIQYEVQCTVGELNLVYLQTFYETRTRFSQLLCWTVPSRFEKLKIDFETMAASFHQRPQPGAATTQPAAH